MKYYRARTGRARRRLAAILCSTAACTWSCAGQCQNASSGNAETYPSTSAARTNDTGNAPLGSGAAQSLYAPTAGTIPQRKMVVIVTGSAFFDSNATRTNSLRNNAGHSKEDFLFPVGGVIDIVVPSGENVFALQGSVRYDFYSRNKDLSSQNINLRGDYRRTLNPCNIDLDGSLIHSLTDFANSADLTFQKNLQTIEQVEGTLTCGSATGLRPFATLNYTNARNSIVEREVNDYDNIVYGGGVALVDGSAGTLGVIGSLSRNIYPGRPSGGELGPRGVHVKSIGAYFQRSSARILQASVQLNYTVVSQASGTPPFHGLSGSVLVHYMPGGRIAFDAMVSRAVQTAFTNTASYTIETDYSLSAGAPI